MINPIETKLTAAEIDIANSYVENHSFTETAKECSVEVKDVKKIMKSTHVQEYVLALFKAKAMRKLLNPDYIYGKLVDEVERTLDPKNSVTQANRIKALELLGKYLGMSQEKVNVEVNGTINNIVATAAKLAKEAMPAMEDDLFKKE